MMIHDLTRAIKKNIGQIGRRVKLVEVCGTHTHAIHRLGLPALFADEIEFVSGPGCPICVTEDSFIDQLAELALQFTVYTFGDMVRVPGRYSSLARARAEGGDVRIMLSPLDAVAKAAAAGKPSVIAAVGFETTAPAFALAVDTCIAKNIANVRFLTELKTIREPLGYLLHSGTFDGIILPGHVAVVIGARGFEFVEQYGIPSCITGFEAADVLQGIFLLTEAIMRDNHKVHNQYTRVVRDAGNLAAQEMITKYFKPADTVFRGIGHLPGSGLALKDEYTLLEYPRRSGLYPPKQEDGCRCGDVLIGRIKPNECPLFGSVCRPDQPRGACMVSTEGSCSAYFRFRGAY